MKASTEVRLAIDKVIEAGPSGWCRVYGPLRDSRPDACCFMIRAWNRNLLHHNEKVEAAAIALGFDSMYDLNDSSEDFAHMLMRVEMVYNLLVKEGN